MFKPADVRQVLSALKPLTCSIDQDEIVCCKPEVKRYLNHYNINFENSLENVRHGMGTFEAEGYTLACHYWFPAFSKGTIFIIHGYFDHVGLFNHLIRFSLQNDYSVVAYDLPGMGLTSGERGSIDSFAQYHGCMMKCLQLFKGTMPKPWHGVGQSTGATSLIQQLLTTGLAPFEKIVLLAPLIQSFGWRRSRWTYAIGRFFLRTIPRVFVENTHDKEFLRFIKKDDPLQDKRMSVRWVGAMKQWISTVNNYETASHDVLIVQGTNDTTVDADYNLELLKNKLPNATIKMVPEGRHHLVAESAPYRAQVFAAIKSYLEK